MDFFGAFNDNLPSHFEQDYQCFPASFAGRDDIDKGNKIILPGSALELLARLNVSYPMMFQIYNARDERKSHCGVLEFVADEGMCYMPYWMMQNLLLREGDIVRITNTTLPKGTFVKLQPVTKDFLDIHNPKAVLENSLRHFATLTKGETIVLKYNNRTYEIDIVATKPSDAISIVEADVEVDFAPPKDYVEPQRVPQPATAPEQPPAPEKGGLFSGSGQQLNGKQAKKLPPIQPKPTTDPWGEEPWLLRVPGGVRRKAPYGYEKR